MAIKFMHTTETPLAVGDIFGTQNVFGEKFGRVITEIISSKYNRGLYVTEGLCEIVVEDQLAPKKTVYIPAREEHDGFHGVHVTIDWICPECGGPRGDVYKTSFDGSRRLHVDGWKNPCGHVDKYSAVRKEAGL